MTEEKKKIRYLYVYDLMWEKKKNVKERPILSPFLLVLFYIIKDVKMCVILHFITPWTCTRIPNTDNTDHHLALIKYNKSMQNEDKKIKM